MDFGKSGQPLLLTMIFAAGCVLSALALIYAKHESRKLFVELEKGSTISALERDGWRRRHGIHSKRKC